jgi:hypothetical protein
MAEDEIVVVELEKSKPLTHWIFHDLSAKASENQRVYLFVPEEDRALLFHFLSERWGTEKTGKMPFLWQWGEDPDEKLGEGAVYNKTTGFITTDKVTWENFEAYKTAKTLGTVEAINEYFRKYPQGPKTGVKQRLPWQSWIQPILEYVTNKSLTGGWTSEEEVYREFLGRGASREDVEKAISQLIREGTLYTPRLGFLRKT